MTNFRAALLLKNPTGPYGFKGNAGYNSIIEKILNKERRNFENQTINDMLFFEEYVVLYDFVEKKSVFSSKVTGLMEYIENHPKIKIVLNNKFTIYGFGLNIVYNWRVDKWYFSYRDENKKISVIKVDKILKIDFIRLAYDFEIKESMKLKNILQMNIEKDFGISLEKSIDVKVLFFNHFNVVEKVINKFRKLDKDSYYLDDGSLYLEFKTSNVMDFFAWVRQFGSSVVILSPDWLIKKHINSANKVIKNYEEFLY
jgi:hypothetical protein